MALSQPMCGILKVGAEKERAARDFYLDASRKTRQALGKKMFDQLAADETQHEQLLQSWANQGFCPANVTYPTVDAAFLKRGRQEVAKAVKPETTDLEAIEFAQEMERKAIAFYRDAVAKAEDQPSKDLLARLKAEEDKHLALLTDLYEYMKDPAIWSVREGGAHFDS
ncbi:MAG TPA: ferritin family protein [Phycisphaerae bacterium]|nr:ferritin family protein [Phycisphaerae bacterium]